MIGRNVDSVITNRGYAYPWGNVLPLLQSTDVNIINLETTLTYSNNEVPKVFNFKASPDKVNVLTKAHITAVNLANNHILDYSEEGLFETIENLEAARILHTGAGSNYRAAATPVIMERNNIRIGLQGFTDNEPAWKALADRSGTNYINIASKRQQSDVLSSLASLSEQVDLLIVSIHWGPNMKEKPDEAFIEFAHAMVDNGAGLIHGHSAHNFQGIEVYGHGVILYDTGDFIDDYMVNLIYRNDHSFFFLAEAGNAGVMSLRLIPVLINRCQVNLAVDGDYDWSIRRMQELSLDFGTIITDNGEVILREDPAGEF
jgi:poly-gamma-glutamate capsule biosynthesis protein CapA/YwtB (metallophosphatase superfamily)